MAHARVVAAALREGFAAAGVPWFRVHPEVPHTHQFQVWLPYDAGRCSTRRRCAQAEETGVTLFRSWFSDGPAGLAVTEVTVASQGLEWTAEDVRAAVADFVARVRSAADGRARCPEAVQAAAAQAGGRPAAAREPDAGPGRRRRRGAAPAGPAEPVAGHATSRRAPASRGRRAAAEVAVPWTEAR